MMRDGDGAVPAPQQTAQEDNDEVDAELEEKMRKYPQDFDVNYQPRRTFGFAWSGGFASPFVSTKQPVIDEILQTLSLSSSSVVMDLGAGAGAFVIETARRVGCRCLGIELDEALVAEARRSAERVGVAALVAFYARDMFAVFGAGGDCAEGAGSASQADVLYLYQLPAALKQLEPHIVEWLAVGGTRTRRTVCCVTWPLSDALAGHLDPPDPAVHARRGFYVYRNG